MFQFIQAQLDYHTRAVKVLDSILPTLRSLLGKIALYASLCDFLSKRTRKNHKIPFNLHVRPAPPLLSNQSSKIANFYQSDHCSLNLSLETATTFNAGDLNFFIIFSVSPKIHIN